MKLLDHSFGIRAAQRFYRSDSRKSVLPAPPSLENTQHAEGYRALSTAGWFLAARLGFTSPASMQYRLVIIAVVIVAILTVQGWECSFQTTSAWLESRKASPFPGSFAGSDHCGDGALRLARSLILVRATAGAIYHFDLYPLVRRTCRRMRCLGRMWQTSWVRQHSHAI